MATLNIGMKINGGGTINLTTAGTTTVLTTGVNEYADVNLVISATFGIQPTSVSVLVGGVQIALAAVSGSSTARVGESFASDGVTLSGNLLSFRVPPSTSLVITRVLGLSSSLFARGMYTRVINTQ
jgi:hypothetical protein